MTELLLALIYLIAFILGVLGIIYSLTNELIIVSILCVIFVFCVCIRIDIFFNKINDNK